MNNIHFELFKTLLIVKLTGNPNLNISSDIVFEHIFNTSKVLSDRFINRTILLEQQKEAQLLNEDNNET